MEASTKGTIPHLPNIEDYLVLPIKSEPHLLSDTSDEDTPRKRRRIDQGDTLPDLEMWGDIELGNVPRLCIERPSPLVCVNQDLASQQPYSGLMLMGRLKLLNLYTSLGCLKRGVR